MQRVLIIVTAILGVSQLISNPKMAEQFKNLATARNELQVSEWAEQTGQVLLQGKQTQLKWVFFFNNFAT